MIVDFDGLAALRGKVAMVDGGFDPLHDGHVAYFEEAAKVTGLPVLCNISSDAYVSTKHRVFLAQEHRGAVIDALKPIAYVHLSSRTTKEILEQLRPAKYVKGKDWEGRLPAPESAVCKAHGIEPVYLDTVLNSSTKLVKAFLDSGTIAQQVAGFQDFVLNQNTTGASDYDDGYFHDAWRDGANDYTVEARRRMEGKNPALIKEVFQPQHVIDMGCGPGALMYLLHELGVNADGVDFTESSKKLAPKEVADRIHIGSIIDIDLPTDSYDLLICREVFEHLSVLQVQQTVANLARITSKYIYLTTRFHPAPATLFDVTTEFEVDPTHITCMNIELLRLMFVLQGMKRRVDLEEKMDWLKKGRVLIYEKIRSA